RKFAGATATSNGLYLVGVEYPKKFALSSSRQDVSYWSES
ncbi:MAG: hypothetical protein ACI9LU_002743, partial [Polaribacter sp.]